MNRVGSSVLVSVDEGVGERYGIGVRVDASVAVAAGVGVSLGGSGVVVSVGLSVGADVSLGGIGVAVGACAVSFAAVAVKSSSFGPVSQAVSNRASRIKTYFIYSPVNR